MTRICKILVVEDNEGIRELLQTLFDDEGYQIGMAASGEEMRAAMARDTFDLAIIDVTLPRGEDGFALAGLAAAAGTAVVLVTGDTRHFEAIKQSGYPFLLKPFRIERLLALVHEVLRQIDACVVPAQRSG
jgi:two-component system OmpR family response regulator